LAVGQNGKKVRNRHPAWRVFTAYAVSTKMFIKPMPGLRQLASKVFPIQLI